MVYGSDRKLVRNSLFEVFMYISFIPQNRGRRLDFPIHNRIQKMTSWIRSESFLAFEIGSIQSPITHVQYHIDSQPLYCTFISLVWAPVVENRYVWGIFGYESRIISNQFSRLRCFGIRMQRSYFAGDIIEGPTKRFHRAKQTRIQLGEINLAKSQILRLGPKVSKFG